VTEQRIEPHKVTKPIQLLAAWLVGLVLTNASFLVTATQIAEGSWERGALVMSAIINAPLFLLALFVLQTRFRAELQEDTFYADYLSKKTSTVVRIDKNAAQDARLEELERGLARLTVHSIESMVATAESEDTSLESLNWSDWPVALNERHPRFKEVRDALRKANIPLSDIFGGTSDAPPSKWIISLSHHLPVAHKVHLLRAVLPFGFDGIQFWEPQREAEENEDVYIGSYGDSIYARVTSDLSELLLNEVEAADLSHYYMRNKVRRAPRRKDA
jgi:hypothetical protein